MDPLSGGRERIEEREQAGGCHGRAKEPAARRAWRFPPASLGEDGRPDRQKWPGLMVELEDRVHPLEALAIGIAEIHELTAGDHRESESDKEESKKLRRGQGIGSLRPQLEPDLPGRQAGEKKQRQKRWSRQGGIPGGLGPYEKGGGER